MTDRLPCKTPGCPGQMLPSTAEATGGFCMRCINRQKAEARARKIAAERVDVDRFAGLDDRVEILRRIHCPPPYDPLKNDLPYAIPTADVYRALSQAEVDRLVATADADDSDDLLRDVASHLACFSPRDITTCQNRLLDRGDPYPPHAFRGASDRVVQRLLDVIDEAGKSASELLLDHALSALAWSRSPRAEKAQRRWRDAPPPWRKSLHLLPERHAIVAGYELDGDSRRELLLPAAYKLTADSRNAHAGTAAVFEDDPSGMPCPQCKRPATLLLRLDAPMTEGVSLGLRGALLVPTCVDCAMYETVFVRFAGDSSRWDWLTPLSASSGGHPNPLEVRPTPVLLTPREPWAAVDASTAEGISQFGGHPAWINDPEFPPCPACARTMMTVAQVAPEDFIGPAEGVFYAHLCPPCAVVGVSYDQT